jgi:hypothetical protein
MRTPSTNGTGCSVADGFLSCRASVSRTAHANPRPQGSKLNQADNQTVLSGLQDHAAMVFSMR